MVFSVLFGNILVGMGEYFILKRGNLLEMIVIGFRPCLAEVFSKQTFTGLAMVLIGIFLIVAPSLSMPSFDFPRSANDASSTESVGSGRQGLHQRFTWQSSSWSDVSSHRVGPVSFGQFALLTLVIGVIVGLRRSRSAEAVGKNALKVFVVWIVFLFVMYQLGPSIFSSW